MPVDALSKENIVTEQIGRGAAPTLTFFVESMGVRRELIPEVRDGKNGYLCVTFTNTPVQRIDRVVATQSDFEKILVDLRLMDPNAPSRTLASVWPSQMDDLARDVNKLIGRFTGSHRLETWLPILR